MAKLERPTHTFMAGYLLGKLIDSGFQANPTYNGDGNVTTVIEIWLDEATVESINERCIRVQVVGD